MAVSKTKPKEAVIEAYKAGQRVFGENYIQVMIMLILMVIIMLMMMIMSLMSIVLTLITIWFQGLFPKWPFHLHRYWHAKMYDLKLKSLLLWLTTIADWSSLRWLKMRFKIIELIIYKPGVGGEVTGLRVARSVPGYPVALHWKLSDQQGGSH